MTLPSRKRLILMVVLLLLTVAITALVRIDFDFAQNNGRAQVLAGTYATLGDVCVFLNVILLGGPWGAVVSALGCGIADILVGSTSYVIGTLVIKALMALFLGRFARHCDAWKKSIVVSLVTEAIMVVGYFVFDLVIFVEYTVAFKEILVNLGQGIVCAAIGAGLIHFFAPVVRRVKAQNRARAR